MRQLSVYIRVHVYVGCSQVSEFKDQHHYSVGMTPDIESLSPLGDPC